jgi:hypothetical protein
MRSVAEGMDERQVAFISEFMRSDSHRRHVLAAPLGTGKGHTAAAIAHDLLVRGAGPVLLIAETRAGRFFAQNVANHGVASVELTKARLRTLDVDARLADGAATLAVVSPRVVDDPWARHVLSRVRWGLMIIDADVVDIDSSAALEDCAAGARRLLVLVDSRNALDRFRWLADAAVTTWETPWLVDAHQPAASLRHRFVSVFYDRTDEEVAVILAVEELIARAGQLAWPLGLTQLRSAAHSSYYALQMSALTLLERLRSRRNMAAHGQPAVRESGVWTADRHEQQAAIVAAYSAIEQIVAMIDALEFDSKANALLRLTPASEARAGSSAAIFCEHPATADYLRNTLSFLHIPAVAVKGRRGDLVSRRADASTPVVVATDAGVRGLDLRDVSRAVNYDVVPDPARMHLRWSRLSWSDPLAPLQIQTLFPGQPATRREAEVVERMTYLLG